LAPGAQAYVATDISGVAVRHVQELARWSDLPHVHARRQAAHDFIGLAELAPDLVLLDLLLPDANGFDVHQELRKVVPSAKVLFLSGYADDEIVGRALTDGAGGYLLKANANQELVAAMDAVVLGRTFVSSGLKATRDAAQPLVYELATT